MCVGAGERPAAPAQFTASVLQRVRRERWRSEQRVDRLFNVAMAVALLLVAGGILALMNLSGVMAAASGAWTIVASLGGQVAREAAPSMNTYIAAVGLFVSVMGMWWWADRTLWM